MLLLLLPCLLGPPSSAVPALEDTFQFSFSPVTVGVRFAVVTSGYLTAVRFVKPSGDVSQHTVKVWDDASQGNLYSETLQVRRRGEACTTPAHACLH